MMFRSFVGLSGAVLLSNVTSSSAFNVPWSNSNNSKRLLPPRRSSPSSTTSPAIGYSSDIIASLEDEQQKEVLKRRLPPIDKQTERSKLQVEFRELLEGILYTESEIEAVVHPRMRVIMEGISASYYEPAVYRAFEVLYEDYIPLRIAGRMVYRRLRDVMEESREYKQLQVKAVVNATNMSRVEVESCWSTFIRLGKSQRLPLERLQRLMGEPTLNYLDVKNIDEAIGRISSSSSDDASTESLSFEELMIGLLMSHENCQTKIASTTQQQTTNFLQQVLDSDRVLLAEKADFSSRLDARHLKYNDRYDEMLEQFGKWKAYIPNGDGRRLDILKGCFVGSENPAVVEALRIIYVDYSALRLSGDWIFKVVSTIMGSVERRRMAHQQQQSS